MSCTGVLVAGRADGIVEAWDLLDRSHEPVLAITVATVAVTTLCFSLAASAAASKGRSTQQLLAIGKTLLMASLMALYIQIDVDLME